MNTKTLNKFYDKFTQVQEDKAKVATFLQRYEQKKATLSEYLIALTPRSGSSWLTELLAATRLAGNPEEWFNHNSLEGILKNYKCSNLEDYLKCIKGHQSTPNGWFGVEASFFQFNLVLEHTPFEKIFQENLKVIYLTRNDFISQGISLYKAVETGVFHSFQGDRSSQECQYDPKKLEYWILHILYQEYYWERFFTQKQINPLRISYEELVKDTNETVQKIFCYLNIPEGEKITIPQETKHRQLANKVNQSLYDSFQENQEFIENCHQYRGKPKILKITA
jgi:LPS sulfotransferase NodH